MQSCKILRNFVNGYVIFCRVTQCCELLFVIWCKILRNVVLSVFFHIKSCDGLCNYVTRAISWLRNYVTFMSKVVMGYVITQRVQLAGYVIT